MYSSTDGSESGAAREVPFRGGAALLEVAAEYPFARLVRTRLASVSSGVRGAH
jgi:hypothetical protein